jgi:type II secretory pathway component PulJ
MVGAARRRLCIPSNAVQWPGFGAPMSERDSDIEFDFFDEGETREATEVERRPRRGPRPPVRPPAGLTPLLRLVGLISFAILVVVLLVFWVNSCREDRRKEAYRDYIEDVSTLAADSEALGRNLTGLLTSRGLSQGRIEQRLEGLAQQQEQVADQARDLDPPGPLRQQNRHAVEAFDFRVSALRGMAQAFRQTAAARQPNQAGQLLAEQARRFIASDVVWDDLFAAAAAEELENQEISGVQVPDSTFLQNADIATTTSMRGIWQRIRGAATGGGQCSPRGTGIVSVSALPGRQRLSPTTLNTVESTNDLAFAVVIENSGCAQESSIPVTLTIQKSPTPIVKRRVLDLINPSESKTVTFADIGTVPFAERTSVAVEVEPVPSEGTTDNNSAEYPVIFSLG